MSDVPVGPDTLLADRYRLAEPIGFGGMATVYRATDERLGRDVAVKVFRRDVAEAVDLQRIQREVRILAGLQSPYVVTVFDAVESDTPGLAYLVLELVEGSDLRTLLERPRRPSAEFVRRIVADIASALEALHSQGIVHRDVKPANVLVLAGANRRANSIAAKLSDFGIAQSVDSTRLTATNFILGTAAYLSPEQVRGARLRPATDVYSLGLMLIEALTGKPAFPGPVAESAAARLARPPQLPRNSSPALADLLSRMTAIDPGERPRAGEVAAALHDLAGGMTATRSAVPRTSPLPLAPAMPLRPAAFDGGEPTALAERPRWRKTNTAPVRLAAGGAGAGAVLAAVAETGPVAAAETDPAAADAGSGAAADPAEVTAARPVLPQDELPTAQTPLPAADAGEPPPEAGEPSAEDGEPPAEDDGLRLLEGELPLSAVAVPAGEHKAGPLQAHPRATVLATLAACALMVGAGSVVLASTGGPILAGADEGTQRPVAALLDPSSKAPGAGTSSATSAQVLEAQRRTEDLITTMGAIEAGIADTPPLVPTVLATPKHRATSSAPIRARSSTTTSSSTATHSSTPTHSTTPTPTPTKTTSTPTPTPTKTTTPTPTPTKTTTPSPTPTPTTSASTTSPPTTAKPTSSTATSTSTVTSSSTGGTGATGGATGGTGSGSGGGNG